MCNLHKVLINKEIALDFSILHTIDNDCHVFLAFFARVPTYVIIYKGPPSIERGVPREDKRFNKLTCHLCIADVRWRHLLQQYVVQSPLYRTTQHMLRARSMKCVCVCFVHEVFSPQTISSILLQTTLLQTQREQETANYNTYLKKGKN